MNRAVFIFVLAVVLASGVCAVINDSIQYHFTFDIANMSATNLWTYDGAYNATWTGLDRAAGIRGEGVHGDGSSAYATFSSTGSTTQSYNFWYKVNGTWTGGGSLYNVIYTRGGASGTPGSGTDFDIYMTNTTTAPYGKYHTDIESKSGFYYQNDLHNGTAWTMVTVTWNDSSNTLKFYRNGVLVNTSTALTDAGGTANATTYFGRWQSTEATYALQTNLDEFTSWSRVLTDDEITWLWNGSAGVAYPFNVSGTGGTSGNTSVPSWVSPTPADAANSSDTTITLNASCGENTTFLWYGASSPPTSLVLDNSSTGNYTVTLSTLGTYYYTAACYNLTTGMSANTSTRSYIFYVAPPNAPTWSSPTPDGGEINNTATITLNASCGQNQTYLYFGNDSSSLPLSRVGINGSLYCYQENATATGTCGEPSNGSYAQTPPSTVGGTVYVNYSKPSWSTAALWRVKHSYVPFDEYITVSAGCFAQNPLQFKHVGNFSATYKSLLYCYNGSSWVNIGSYQSGSSYNGGGGAQDSGADDWKDGNYDSPTLAESINGYLIDVTGNTSQPFASSAIYEEAVYWLNETFPLPIDDTYYYKASCYNSTLTGMGANSTLRNYTYDSIFPSYAISENNEFVYSGIEPVAQRSGFDAYDNVLNLSLNFTDNRDLYAWELNVTYYANGTSVYYESNSSLSGTIENFVRALNITTWTANYYNLSFAVSDSHTDENIGDYQVTKKKSSITFKTPNDNNIKVETREPSDISATKLSDRYTFTVSFNDGLTKTRRFDVKSECPLSYRTTSGYKAHFVAACGSAREGGNWLDFEGVSGAATVTKADDYHYIVDIADVPPTVTFNSIGGLNVYEASFVWYRPTITVTTTATQYLNYTSSSNATITWGDSAGLNNVTVYFNDAAVTPTATGAIPICVFPSACNLTYTVNLTSPSTAATYPVTWLLNQSPSDALHNDTTTSVIYSDWNVTSCGAAPYDVERIQYKSYLEDTPASSLGQDFQLYGSYWLSDSSINKTVNLTFAANDTFHICVYPNVTMYFDLYAVTNASGYTHRHYIQNTSLAFGLWNYSLYNHNTTTGLSLLRVTARDKDTYNYYLNVLGVLQRFYVSEGVWRSVQMDRSGDYGLLVYDIKELTTDYRLAYYDRNNNLLLTTQSVKFSCTSGVCEVTQLLSPYEADSDEDTITTTYAYDNATEIVTVNWSSSALTSSTVNITITHETLAGQSVACSTTQTGVAGNYTCNVSLYNSNFLVTLMSGSSVILNEWVNKAPTRLADSLSVGEQAFWSFALLVTVSAAGLFSPAGVLVMSTLGLILVTIIGILTPLTLTVLFVAAIIGFVLAVRLKT